MAVPAVAFRRPEGDGTQGRSPTPRAATAPPLAGAFSPQSPSGIADQRSAPPGTSGPLASIGATPRSPRRALLR